MTIPDPSPEQGEVVAFIAVSMTNKGVILYGSGGPALNNVNLLGLLEMAKLDFHRSQAEAVKGPQIIMAQGPFPNLKG